jgi:putative FmdB family regulatory protein
MPLYEYFCSDCRAKFTALRPSAQADTPIACEQCAGPHTGRVLSVFFAPARSSSRAGAYADSADADSATDGGCGCGGMCACGHGHN